MHLNYFFKSIIINSEAEHAIIIIMDGKKLFRKKILVKWRSKKLLHAKFIIVKTNFFGGKMQKDKILWDCI